MSFLDIFTLFWSITPLYVQKNTTYSFYAPTLTAFDLADKHQITKYVVLNTKTTANSWIKVLDPKMFLVEVIFSIWKPLPLKIFCDLLL